MSEVEKKESQKTVVAFITGLLIGGLLVWVFASTPETKKNPSEEKTDTEQVTKSETEVNVSENNPSTSEELIGEGSLVVKDQAAGKSVLLESTKLPTKNGWVVVRDFMDGVPGNILGAARYSAEEGLTPMRVDLIRSTVSGSSYQVVFFTNVGDAGFSLSEDMVIGGIATTFKAN